MAEPDFSKEETEKNFFDKILLALSVVLFISGIATGLLDAIKSTKWLLGSGGVCLVWIVYRRLADSLDNKITKGAKDCTNEDREFALHLAEKKDLAAAIEEKEATAAASIVPWNMYNR